MRNGFAWVSTVLFCSLVGPIGLPDLSPSPKEELWRIESRPALVLGGANGPQEQVFTNIVGAVELTDGTIVIADYSRNYFEIRYFGPNGEFITSAGRYGQGPFELSYLGPTLFARTPGDSIMVAGIDGRFSIFGPRGEQVRSNRVQLPVASVPSGLIRYPTHLAAWKSSPRGRSATRGQSAQSEIILLAVDLRDSSADTIGTFAGPVTALAESGLFLHFPFVAHPYFATGSGGVVYGHASERALYRYLPGTGEELFCTLAIHRNPVSGANRREWLALDLEDAPDSGRREVGEHHRSLTFPDSFPLFQGLKVGMGGTVWVLAYQPPFSQEDFRWHVFGPSGDPLAEVVMPFEVGGAYLRARAGDNQPMLMHVSESSILVVTRDDIGIQRVQLHRILKQN